MFRIIFLTILGAAVLSLLVFLGAAAGILYSNISESQLLSLRNELALVSSGVEQGGKAYLDSLRLADARISWIDPDGRVRYETHADAASLDNHFSRKEVEQTLATGSAEICRYSSTLGRNFCYAAKLLPDGSIVRMGISADSFQQVLLTYLKPLFFAILVCIGIIFFLSKTLAKKIVSPLEAIDLDRPLENDAYPEIIPFLRRIEKQKNKITRQYNEIRQYLKDFLNISSSMSEGLIVLDSSFSIININASARTIFNAPENCVGHNFLQIDRNTELNKALELALNDDSQKLQLSRNDHIYIVTINRFDHSSYGSILVLLVLDITEQAQAEQRRREFCANVSHELKTPLQTIIGSSEMLENGLVKEEDVSSFAHKIHKESKHLLNMTNDILHLSFLDEQAPHADDNFDLYEIVDSCQRYYSRLASEKNVSIIVAGEKAIIHGVKSIAEEIVYNLCENGIKYNKPDGSVKLTVSKENDSVVLKVIDSGIGISKADLDRIFERFYRCDKSHSKTVEGTGLGLSIVKQALKHFNAKINVISEPGLGSKFTVVFHAKAEAEL